jgi:hypothetical protein
MGWKNHKNTWRWVVSSTHRPHHTRWKSTVYPLAGCDQEPLWTTWGREKSYFYRDSNSDPSAVQPVARSHTDCAIPALLLIQMIWEIIVIMNIWMLRLWSTCICLGSLDTEQCYLERDLFICLYVCISAPLGVRTVGWILFTRHSRVLP